MPCQTTTTTTATIVAATTSRVVALQWPHIKQTGHAVPPEQSLSWPHPNPLAIAAAADNALRCTYTHPDYRWTV